MGNFISVSLTTLVVFLAMITSLAAKPDTIKKLNICFVVFCGISGLLIYGYGYSITEPSKPLAVVHTLLAVCSILVGGSNFDAVSGTPFFQQEWAKILFWVIHLMARYAFASAAVILPEEITPNALASSAGKPPIHWCRTVVTFTSL